MVDFLEVAVFFADVTSELKLVRQRTDWSLKCTYTALTSTALDCFEVAVFFADVSFEATPFFEPLGGILARSICDAVQCIRAIEMLVACRAQ